MMKEHKEGSLPLCTFLVRMLQGDAHRPWSCPSGNFRWCPVRHFRNLQTCNGVIVQSAKVLFYPYP